MLLCNCTSSYLHRVVESVV